MPDITMCSGERCPLRHTCYRHTATPSTRQAYFMVPPFEEEEDEEGYRLYVSCEYYSKE